MYFVRWLHIPDVTEILYILGKSDWVFWKEDEVVLLSAVVVQLFLVSRSYVQVINLKLNFV